MQRIKAIIVDDEPNARMALRGILEENFFQVDILAECKDVPSAVKAIHKLKPDLVFLDIDMPGYSGFELLDFFEDEPLLFKIIFVTAYSEHSLRAFEASAVDYILKPIRVEHVARAINKFNMNESVNELQQFRVLRDNFTNASEKKVVLQTLETIFVLGIDDIMYLEADRSYTRFYTTTQGILTITKKLIEFEFLEELGTFFRSHRSYIINLRHIKKVDKKELVIFMSNDAQVYLAQEKKVQFLDRMMI